LKSKKTDRRSKRTQQLVGDAFITLLLEKRYEDITIQDILERANIGRSTFYEHYWDKEDLLTSQIEQMLEHLSQQVDTSQQDISFLIPSLALFQHVQDYYRLYQALLQGRGMEIVTQALQEQLQARIETLLQGEDKKRDTATLIAAVACYIAGAFISLLRWWIQTEMTWSPERIDALFREIAQSGLGKTEQGTSFPLRPGIRALI
jgi:AcrR family transcriptional regulator